MVQYTFNLNSYLMVSLTDLGYQRMADLHNKFIGLITDWESRTAEYYKAKADENGYTRFQAWDFMEKFGSTCGMAKPLHFAIDILLDEKYLKPGTENSE